jgi:Gpi18-like mannosyltransferase
VSSALLAQNELTYGATNWYQWIPDPGYPHLEPMELAGIAMTLLATALFVLWMARSNPANAQWWMISLALLSVLFPPFLLPGMHERCFFSGDVLSVVYAFCVPGGWRVAALMQFASAFSYVPFLFGHEPAPRTLLALAVAMALGLVITDIARVQRAPGPQKEAP